jgi:pimeloyl-ACP methyl ester carboxylesterase
MGSEQLVVFVHGWGANNQDWWGATRSSFKSHSEFNGKVEFLFHGYATSKRPQGIISRIREILGSQEKLQDLAELGQQLWSDLRQEYRYQRSVVLFGHSFGGLVVASAIGYGIRQNSKDDKAILAAICGIGLCCTPIGGADLADIYERITSVLGKNRQVLDLQKSSPLRTEVVNEFMSYIRPRLNNLTIFRASGDGTVQSKETIEPFLNANLSVIAEVIRGNHSDCVQNIGEYGPNKENFEKLATWIKRCLKIDESRMRPAAEPKLDKKSERTDFNESLSGLSNEINGSVLKNPLSEHVDVPRMYLLRIFLQKLVYTATLMHEETVGSANLWVAHIDSSRNLHLRSEEREGFFSIDQLVVDSSEHAVVTPRVTIRRNLVQYDGAKFDSNSAGARAFIKGKPQLVNVLQGRSGPGNNRRPTFPSESDLRTGITHILGIPLTSREEFEKRNDEMKDGVPLALTIDFAFSNDPSDEIITDLSETAANIQAVYERFVRSWPQDSVRYVTSEK